MVDARSATVRAVLDAAHEFVDPAGQLFFDWAVIGLLRLSPTASAISSALADEGVWPASRRMAIMKSLPPSFERFRQQEGTFGRVNPGGLTKRTSKSISFVVSAAEVLARTDGSPEIREWHLARAIIDADAEATLRGLGIDVEALLLRVGNLEGRVELDDESRAKAWCFIDTNVFIHFQMFDQVNWPQILGWPAVVLVVTTTVLRELDVLKFESGHSGKRARKVLPLLAKYALDVPAGVLSLVRKGVELHLRLREPFLPAGFDPRDQDDRIIADALDFRWTHPGATVVVLSQDYTIRLKARGRGLEQISPPADLKLPSSRFSDESAEPGSAGH